ncbi:hypothetical protein M0208_06235 [Sphingomonas sp. SUN019]|uniref:hypothetical protein n=1 Tax=Sphingomonas sp. SUN019 TaxID=2937788 RepID=UPI002164A0B9|nr:hypothetical protein [Sphingomonas sp. SUN019]UVO50135.1 hypothetical protein M0208_06235 [Sphingomonas sp. SUN019]
MGKIDDMRHWLAAETSDEERAAIERRVNPPGGGLAALNVVAITGLQMRAAIEAIQHVPVRSDADVVDHARILRAFAQEYGFSEDAGAAFHARAIAMDTWCHRHDPFGQTDVAAFFEAGATCPLIETDEGVVFDPQIFGDLIVFIAELPF